MEFTDRGFAIYLKGKDSKGNEFRVQDSSACEIVDENGSTLEGPWCWLFLDGQVTGKHLGLDITAALHLNVDQARELAKALLEFSDGYS